MIIIPLVIFYSILISVSGQNNVEYCFALPSNGVCHLNRVFSMTKYNETKLSCHHNDGGNLILQLPHHIYIDIRYSRYAYELSTNDLQLWSYLNSNFRPEFYIDVPYHDVRVALCFIQHYNDSQDHVAYGNASYRMRRFCYYNFTTRYRMAAPLYNSTTLQMRIKQTSTGVRVYELYQNFTVDSGFILHNPKRLMMVGLMMKLSDRPAEQDPPMNIEIPCSGRVTAEQGLTDYRMYDGKNVYIRQDRICETVIGPGLYNLMSSGETHQFYSSLPLYTIPQDASREIIIRFDSIVRIKRSLNQLIYRTFEAKNLENTFRRLPGFVIADLETIEVKANDIFSVSCSIKIIDFETGIVSRLETQPYEKIFAGIDMENAYVTLTTQNGDITTYRYTDSFIDEIVCGTQPNTDQSSIMRIEQAGLLKLSKDLAICSLRHE